MTVSIGELVQLSAVILLPILTGSTYSIGSYYPAHTSTPNSSRRLRKSLMSTPPK